MVVARNMYCTVVHTAMADPGKDGSWPWTSRALAGPYPGYHPERIWGPKRPHKPKDLSFRIRLQDPYVYVVFSAPCASSTFPLAKQPSWEML